ncbi:MAG: membrane protein [Chlamydiales bacterium]|jgi:membrane protein
MLQNLTHFLTKWIWQTPLEELSWIRAFLIRNLRIIHLSLNEFHKDDCSLHASALTYYTLLSIVPMLALAFGVAKGFGLDGILENEILSHVHGQETVILKSITFARQILENTQGGLIAGIGVISLFWTIIKVLTYIEISSNKIWGVAEGRGWARRISDYLSISLICPILFIVANGATLLVSSELEVISEMLGYWNLPLLVILAILPYCAIWALLTFLYLCMPNTKVQFSAALLAAIVAGSLYQIFQWVIIDFQIGIAHYGSIYGSFAALPLFLIWLQASWLIVLLGSELSFTYQNIGSLENEHSSEGMSFAQKKLFALNITQLLVQNLSDGKKPLTLRDIQETVQIPPRTLKKILSELIDCGILFDTASKDDAVIRYFPARDIHSLTFYNIIHALEQYENNPSLFDDSARIQKISASLETYDETLKNSPINHKVKNL